MFALRMKEKKLSKLLSVTPKQDAIEAFWVLDRARMNPEFSPLANFDYPREFLFAKIDEPGAIHGWEIETIITELFATPFRPLNRTLNVRSWQAIADLFNCLRKVEDLQSGKRPEGRIFDELTRVLYRQLNWQVHSKPNAADAVRWWSIMQSQQLGEIFQQRNGVSVKSFIRLALTWNQILSDDMYSPDIITTANFGTSANDALRVTEMLSTAEMELANSCRLVKIQSAELAYRNSPLRQKPIIRFSRDGRNIYVRPIEQLLHWRFTSGLYYDVIGDPRAPNLIGEQFEKYVRRLCFVAFKHQDVVGDYNYGTEASPKKSPDVLISASGKLSLIIECKSRKASLAIQQSLEFGALRKTIISELAKGVVQLNKFYEFAASGQDMNLSADVSLPKLLVTLDDWVFVGSNVREEIEAVAVELAHRYHSRSPKELTSVVFCTATELDQLVSTFEFETILEIIKLASTEKFRTHRLFSMGKQNFREKMRRPNYPLKDELDGLLEL